MVSKLTCWLLAATTVLLCCVGVQCEKSRDESAALRWLHDYNARTENVTYETMVLFWNYYTNLTKYNKQQYQSGSKLRAAFLQARSLEAATFDWTHFNDSLLKRRFSKIADIGKSILSIEEVTEVNNIQNSMQEVYSRAKLCGRPGDTNKSHCYELEPGLNHIQATSSDWDELLWAWKGFRDLTGKQYKKEYVKFVDLNNKAARLNGYSDSGAYWRASYEMENFEEECQLLWQQVKPLFQQLHAYVRRKLRHVYGKHRNEFPHSNHIPAHILGNMWSQTWTHVQPYVVPFPQKTGPNVTKILLDKGYNATTMFRLADEFFVSVGLDSVPALFWEKSMLVKPTDGRDVVCHASALDLHKYSDFRIKQCTDVNEEDLRTAHHEMGHIQYYIQYQHQPVEFRGGANPGFHEAIGDVITLSVSTAEHLRTVGLVETVSNDTESDLNFLMSQALAKVAFLPFGYLIDLWRWRVFSGDILPEQYNREWWKLRCRIQGLSPPVSRSESDFDPGAKYHVASNTPYIRYFISYIIQFQFHKSLCEAAGHKGPLHRCDIYRSRDAGRKLKQVLALGSSKPWPDAFEVITGQRSMNASALLEYFQPLYEWLVRVNSGHSVTWEDHCPGDSFTSTMSMCTIPTTSLYLLQLTIVVILCLHH